MDKNQGYSILKAVMLENGRGFALGEHPTAPSRYVTWACYDDKDGQRQYEWGHYGNDRTAMEQDFTDRVQDYQRIYNVGIRQTSLKLVLGGFHIRNTAKEKFDVIARFFENHLPQRLGVCHCTGIDKYALFHQCFGDRAFYNYTGRVEIL